jgi:hypothetical protein
VRRFLHLMSSVDDPGGPPAPSQWGLALGEAADAIAAAAATAKDTT